MLTRIFLVVLALFWAGMTTNVSAQAVTVVEYYNKVLDAYFITGRASEQSQLDAVADFQRTGMTFQAAAAGAASAATTRICRFYISTSAPFTSSHFYGREGTDCEYIRGQNLPGFSWEDYDFAVAQPSNGVCAANTVAIYRSYRAAANGKTGNHRYSSSAASYIASTNSGYKGEQVAFCATAATEATVAVASDCGTMYYPGSSISYQSLTGAGANDSWVRFQSDPTVIFNGRQATRNVERHSYGNDTTVDVLMIGDSTDTWADLGIQTENADGTLYISYTQPTVFPRRMVAGQRVDINRFASYNPVQNFGSPSQVGSLTLTGRETVTVPAGTFNACKFSGELTTTYSAIGSTNVNQTTTWVASGVGIVKSSSRDSASSASNPSPVVTTTEVQAVTIQPL